MPRLSSLIKSTDIVMGFTNLNSVSHIRIIFGTALNGSICVVNARPFTPERFFELVERLKVTYALLPAYRVVIIMNHPLIGEVNLSTLKFMTSHGSKLPLDFVPKMGKYMKKGKFSQTYGMTETVSTISANLYHFENDCVGQLIGGCEAKIINEQGNRLGINEDGELCIKQPYPFLGYIGESECSFDNEGFFASGDLAHFDQNGDLFIVGRKKEVFKYCCFQVTPSEIEEFLNKLDGVKDSCVVPIPHPEYNNLPAAFVVKSKNSTCTEHSIFDAVSRKIKINM